MLRSCHRPSFPLEFNILCQHQTHLPAVRTVKKAFPLRAGRMGMICGAGHTRSVGVLKAANYSICAAMTVNYIHSLLATNNIALRS